jgi:hypothetical protein
MVVASTPQARHLETIFMIACARGVTAECFRNQTSGIMPWPATYPLTLLTPLGRSAGWDTREDQRGLEMLLECSGTHGRNVTRPGCRA